MPAVSHQSLVASAAVAVCGAEGREHRQSVRAPTFDTRPNYQLMCALNITFAIVLHWRRD